jgi:nitrite reductase/ring-hydroxylating ferredoxin subunit/uncharacterized membrane protein
VTVRSRPARNRIRTAGTQTLSALGRQSWLDRPSYRLEHALTIAFATFGRGREGVINFLHGTWLGHPLHPALTAVPTGAVATTVALDVASVLPGHRGELRDASRLALGVGLLGSVGAAATGLTDWQHTHEQARRVGMIHGALNFAATALYAASWWDRRSGRHARAIAGSAVGYGITLSSGYLGAALVYGSAIGIDRSGPRLVAEGWQAVLPMSELNGKPRRVEVGGIGLVLHRDGDGVLAVGERCPHLGAPMADGWVDRGRVVCPWHGSRFECASGAVIRGPATASLPSYPTRVRHGVVEIKGLADDALVTEALQ